MKRIFTAFLAAVMVLTLTTAVGATSVCYGDVSDEETNSMNLLKNDSVIEPANDFEKPMELPDFLKSDSRTVTSSKRFVFPKAIPDMLKSDSRTVSTAKGFEAQVEIPDFLKSDSRTVTGGLTASNTASPNYVVDPFGRRIAYVYTPRGSQVMVYDSQTWEDVQWANQSDCYELTVNVSNYFPSARMLSYPDPSFNCHSYAWYLSSTTNRYWMDDPSAYITDGSYRLGNFNVGEIVVYYGPNGNIVHSGVITSQGVVTSKWGACGIIEHNILDCPYVYVANNQYLIRSYARNQ